MREGRYRLYLSHNCGQANDARIGGKCLLKKNENPTLRGKANGEHSYHFALKEYLRSTNVYLNLIKSRWQRTLWMFKMKGDCSLRCFSLQRLDEVYLNKKWQALKLANEHWKVLLSNAVQANSKPSHVIFTKLWTAEFRYHNMCSVRFFIF
jgi:hypothetical protein